jgi:hypothetical protein
MIKISSSAEFAKTVGSSKLSVVDFYADWVLKSDNSVGNLTHF